MNILEKLVQQLNLKKQFLMLSLLEAIGFVAVYFDNSWPVILVFLILNVVTALWFGYRSAHRADAIARNLQTIAGGNLSQKFGLQGKDDFAWMAYESDRARKGVSVLIKGVTDTSQELGRSADNMSTMALRTKEAIASQGEHTHQIAASIMQLANQVKEVSAQATRVAASAKEANGAAVGGSKVVGETINSLETISHDVQGIAESITSLQDEINKISSVMQVIRDISEQTNLLALNAAIEAARAGEAGRGFAVVADEVRNLSQRTSKSTEEITQIITNLQGKSHQVAKTVQEKQQDANAAASSAKSAENALNGIVGAVQEIVTLSDAIAELTAQQEAATGGITEAVTYIEGLSRQNADEANSFHSMSQDLSQKAGHLNELVSKFIV
jgi:methyl-accepting chemotaxis protein